MKNKTKFCEIPSHNGKEVRAVGRFQVYDKELSLVKITATMTRPAYMCQGCIDFAEKCGMEVKAE